MSNIKPSGEFKGTITLPKEWQVPQITERVAREIIEKEKPISWGWIFMAGSLIFSLVLCFSRK